MKWIASVYVYRCARSDSDRNADEMENVKTTNEITLGFRMKYRCSGIYPSLIRIKKKQKNVALLSRLLSHAFPLEHTDPALMS